MYAKGYVLVASKYARGVQGEMVNDSNGCQA